ncbi:hypothetical protein M153_3840001524 [Pseudoloma neurophilia]|uniref:Uncharacterized protein n=1 Tax=Pseudoloma neurophilia TaxID=146866 RepID=A0A0R0LXR3_9MICR|nr:hypothetical protein M153_3840001524 [Pseudoloma neurophilia]
MRQCVSCKTAAFCKTNAFYCQKCFLSVLERRARAVIRNILKDECEIFDLDNDFDFSDEPQSQIAESVKSSETQYKSKEIRIIIKVEHKQDCALAFLLASFLHDHALSHVLIERNGKYYNFQSGNTTHELKNLTLKIKTITEKEIESKNTDTFKIIYLSRYTRDDLATLILESTIEYQMREMAKYCTDGYISHGHKVVNALRLFTDKEMTLFLKCQEIEFKIFIDKNDMVDISVETCSKNENFQMPRINKKFLQIHKQIPLKYKKFVAQMNKKNRSTSTNIIETVLKGFRNKKMV